MVTIINQRLPQQYKANVAEERFDKTRYSSLFPNIIADCYFIFQMLMTVFLQRTQATLNTTLWFPYTICLRANCIYETEKWQSAYCMLTQ